MRARLDAGDGVGGGHAEIVVRVHLDLYVHILAQERDDVVGIERIEDAHGVAEAHPVGAALSGGTGKPQQEIQVGA